MLKRKRGKVVVKLVIRQKLYIGVVVVCMLGGIFVGCQKVEAPVEEVLVPEVKIEIEGTVAVEEKIVFNVDFPATVEEIQVKDGQRVKKGEVLLTLDIEDYKQQIKEKENEIALYKLELEGVKGVYDPQNPYITQIEDNIELKQNQLELGTDQDIKKIENSLDVAKESYEKNLKDYETLVELLEIEAISKDEVTRAELGLKEGKKQIENLELSLDQIKQAKALEIDGLKAELKSLTTQVNNGKSQRSSSEDRLLLQMETATLQLENMKNKLQKEYLKDDKLVAPSDDLIIYNIACEKGSKVESLMGPLMEGMDATTLVIEANLPEEYSQDLKIGDHVEVIPYTDQNAVISGTVLRKAEHAIENYGETVIKTIIKVEDSQGLLTVGGSVDIQF